MMRRRLVSTFVLLALATAAVAATGNASTKVTVSLTPIRITEPIAARIVAEPADPQRQARSAQLASGGSVSLLLEPGVWYLHAKAEGLWSEPLPLVVGNTPAAATIPVHRASRVTATVKLPAGSSAREAKLYFQPTPNGDALPTTSVLCPIANGAMTCDVPAGRLDLAFRIEGHVSIYRWNLRAPGGDALDLGTLAFQRGSSFTGYVEVPDVKPAPKVEVVLTPEAGGAENSGARDRAKLASMTTKPNERGFFHFSTAPGNYRVEARAPGFVSAPRDVTILEGREALLREPLRLARPHVLTIRVEPPHDPWKQPWSVGLVRASDDGHIEWQTKAALPLDGTWQSPGVPPGRYSIQIRRTESDAWHSESIDVDGDTSLDIRIATTNIIGRLTLGGEPLRANLFFGGRTTGTRVPVRSRDDGTFRMVLPSQDGDVWKRVDIEATNPPVKRTVKDVRITRVADGPSRIEIDLPATKVSGEVVDEQGQLAGIAIVQAFTADAQTQQIETKDGTFSFAGIEPGRLTLRAWTRDRETERPIDLDVRADSEATTTLIVKPGSWFRGAVRTPWGIAVGASATAFPPDRRAWTTFVSPVDEEGVFKVPLPPGTRDLTLGVHAPGFAFRMMRVGVQSEPPLPIAVDQHGGVLALEVPIEEGTRRAHLIHNGAVMSTRSVAFVTKANYTRVDEKRTRITLPLAEDGAYALCMLDAAEVDAAVHPKDRCVSGLLPRNGALTLAAPDAGSKLTSESSSSTRF